MRTSLMTRCFRRPAPDAGFTLVEVMVTVMLMGIVLPVFYVTLSSVQQSAVRQDLMSRANDQARLAIEELDREIRSGNVLYDPAEETPANFTLRIYTQTNATTRIPTFGNPGYVCALWTINEENQLIKNMWPPLKPGEATGWQVIAEGVVNQDLPSAVPAFTLDPDPLKGLRTVRIRFFVNADLSSSWARTIQIETSSTGRNTSYGFPQDVCNGSPS